MGCSSSRDDTVSASSTSSGWWNRYDELAATVLDFRGPSTEQAEFIGRCPLTALDPSDAAKPPLLALAKDHDEWFRCLLRRCDPGVTWKQGGVTRSLNKELIGHRNYDAWCAAMEAWNEARRNTRDVNARPEKSWDKERWWSEFGMVSIALGFGAAAGVSTGALGFPVVAVGHVIWMVIKKWYNSFETCGPSPNLKKIFSKHASVVGSILKELNIRIENAEKAMEANPGDAAAREESSRQRIRVDALRTLLEEDTEKMESIVQRGSRASDGTKYDEMMKMLRGLLEFQRKLHSELTEERMSDNLGRAVSLLENIEDLLGGGIRSLSVSNDSRTRSLYLDSSANHGGVIQEYAPSHHGSTAVPAPSSTAGTMGQQDGSRAAGGIHFCDTCSSSLHSHS